jgi:H+/gluconate symporter-like permease
MNHSQRETRCLKVVPMERGLVRIGMFHFPTGGPIASLTQFSIFLLSSLGPLCPSVVKFLGPGLLCFWHRLDQQRERLAEA